MSFFFAAPPKNCPVCGERIWDEDRIAAYTAWEGSRLRKELYNLHVHRNHPQFEKWYRRTSFGHFIPILLLLGPAFAGEFLPGTVGDLIFALSWGSGFAGFAIVFLIQRMGQRRLRDRWRAEHA
ncbi:hypothetical protein E6H21_09105 [Candidatus Bathyarchaeota archaeon]|nr:MAG: hypothetical protein E6H21_09105 [Candidatus Bathyarchaeota archaeon]